MAKIIHPNPIVPVANTIFLAAMLSVLFYFVRGYVQGMFVQLLAFVWGLAVLGSVLAFISAKFVTLEIGEKDLVFKKGILGVRTVLVPYSKATDTRYSQSLAERVFGVGTLEIETASESGTAIRMPGVRYEDVKGIMGSVTGKSEGKK